MRFELVAAAAMNAGLPKRMGLDLRRRLELNRQVWCAPDVESKELLTRVADLLGLTACLSSFGALAHENNIAMIFPTCKRRVRVKG